MTKEEFSIEEYNPERDGEAAGVLWANGLLEMLPYLLRATVFHPTVISRLVIVECSLLALSVCFWPGHWILLSIPIALLLSCGGILTLAFSPLVYQKRQKTIRIETAFSSPGKREIISQWVLRSKNDVVGCVSLYKEEDEADGETRVWLGHLTVAPEMRCRGWGNKLASKAEVKAREIEAASVLILVGNAKSKPFWVQRGYRRLYPKWTLLGHESIYMELDLSKSR